MVVDDAIPVGVHGVFDTAQGQVRAAGCAKDFDCQQLRHWGNAFTDLSGYADSSRSRSYMGPVTVLI